MERTVLITGATGGLGRVAVRAFAADGATLVLGGMDAGRVREVAAETGLATGSWHPLVADLRDADATRSALATALEAVGGIDVLLHLVGGFTSGTPVVDLTDADLQAMVDQHLLALHHVVTGVVPGMAERGWGRVVAIVAPVTSTTPAKSGAYAVGKAAQETLLRTLAKEVAPTGVTVNLIQVRAIDVRVERTTDPKKSSWATPEEIVAAIRYLVSDDAAAVNGARITLDGR